MNTPKIERTISTPTGRIDVALFEVTNARAVTWYEVKVRDHRSFPLTETGVWTTIRTYAVEDAARVGFEEWFALETALAVPYVPASEYLIQVYDNDDNDTGIWHKGGNLVDLVDRAAASVADVYGTEVTKVTQGISGGFVDREGRTYRYQAHLI